LPAEISTQNEKPISYEKGKQRRGFEVKTRKGLAALVAPQQGVGHFWYPQGG